MFWVVRSGSSQKPWNWKVSSSPRATERAPRTTEVRDPDSAIHRSICMETYKQWSNKISIIVSKSSHLRKLLFLQFCSDALGAFQRIIKLDWRVICWTWRGEGYTNFNQRFQRLWLFHLMSMSITISISLFSKKTETCYSLTDWHFQIESYKRWPGPTWTPKSEPGQRPWPQPRPKRESKIVMWGQFHSLAMFKDTQVRVSFDLRLKD